MRWYCQGDEKAEYIENWYNQAIVANEHKTVTLEIVQSPLEHNLCQQLASSHDLVEALTKDPKSQRKRTNMSGKS